MTDQELKDIVAAVVAELEKSGVDFDYKAEQAKDDDLVFVIRGTAPNYQGVTVTWKGLLDIITAQATQAKNDAVNAKDIAQQILTQVQSKGSEITNFVTTSKTEIAAAKTEAVNAVKSVYQTDLNELKGDIENVDSIIEIYHPIEKTLNVNSKAWEHNVILDNLTLKKDVTYTFQFSLDSVKENTVYVDISHLESSQYIINTSIPAGTESIIRRFTPTSDYDNVVVRFRTEIDGNIGVTFACTDNQDHANKIEKLDNRILALETETADLKTRVSTIEGVVDGIVKKNTPIVSITDTLSANEVISCVGYNICQGDTISFYGEFTEFDSLLFGNGYSYSEGRGKAFRGAWLEIDSTNVVLKYMSGYTSLTIETYTHGLNLSQFISITIRRTIEEKAIIVITSNGGTFTKELDGGWNTSSGYQRAWRAMDGTVSARPTMAMTNCKVSFINNYADADVHFYGDSYISYWLPYIGKWGLNNKMSVDGFPGRTCNQAIESFRIAKTKSTPKIIVWGMGMNNPDSSSGVNTSWKSTYDEVKTWCNANNVTFIPMTIPTTNKPINNEFKNEIIRQESRYIDIANAVGADGTGNWYTGLQDTDKVHPTTQGGKVIASRIVADVPEIC